MKTQPSQREIMEHPEQGVENAPQNTQPITAAPVKDQSIWAFRWAGSGRGYVWEEGKVLFTELGYRAGSYESSGYPYPTVTISFSRAVRSLPLVLVDEFEHLSVDTFSLHNLSQVGEVGFNEKLRTAKD